MVESTIIESLDRVEREENVRVLYAVESGSRAWGFASTDSDWDVRFIYLHRPEWYLSVQRRRYVLEYPLVEGLDISGRDLHKALGLFAKSNPPLLEWLRSPIIYWDAFSTAQQLRELSLRYFSFRSCIYRYLHMAEGNYREYLHGEEVRVKKYFYVLRPLLACRWIEAHESMPPVEFSRLIEDQLPSSLQTIVVDLINRKRAGEELDKGPRIREINEFVGEEIERLNQLPDRIPSIETPNWDVLDEVFRVSLTGALENSRTTGR
jgi:uncharacterized protein